jgi:hypothetical protein
MLAAVLAKGWAVLAIVPIMGAKATPTDLDQNESD